MKLKNRISIILSQQWKFINKRSQTKLTSKLSQNFKALNFHKTFQSLSKAFQRKMIEWNVVFQSPFRRLHKPHMCAALKECSPRWFAKWRRKESHSGIESLLGMLLNKDPSQKLGESFAKLNFKSIIFSCGVSHSLWCSHEQQWVFWLEFNFVWTTLQPIFLHKSFSLSGVL